MWTSSTLVVGIALCVIGTKAICAHEFYVKYSYHSIAIFV